MPIIFIQISSAISFFRSGQAKSYIMATISEEVYDENNDNCEIVIDEHEEEEMPEDESILSFTNHSDAAYCVAFCKKSIANGIVLASGGGDDKGYIYQLFDGEEPRAIELKGHTDSINAVAFSEDGKYLATGGLDELVILWNPINGEMIYKLTGPTESIEWLAWHPQMPAVLAGDRAGFMWLYSAVKGKCVKVYSQHGGAVTCGGFRAPEGKEIWSAGEDMRLKTWAVVSGQATSQISGILFHSEPIIAGGCSPNGQLIATGDISGIVKISKFGGPQLQQANLDNGDNSIEAIAFSPDSKLIAVASMGGAATIWNPNDSQLRHALKHPAGVTCLKWHPTQPYLITGCADGAVRVWDSRNGKLLKEMTGHTNVITGMDIRFVNDSKQEILIATSSEDHTVKVWIFDEKEIEQMQ